MVTESDKTNTGVVATIVVVGTFSMISISALLTAMVRAEETDLDAKRPMYADLDTIAALDRQQRAALHAAPHWVDQQAGKVGIPIERAMQLVVADFRKDPGAASPPVPPGLVLPPQPPADGSGPSVPGTPAGTVAAPGTAPAAPATGPTNGTAPAAPGTAPATPEAAPAPAASGTAPVPVATPPGSGKP